MQCKRIFQNNGNMQMTIFFFNLKFNMFKLPVSFIDKPLARQWPDHVHNKS